MHTSNKSTASKSPVKSFVEEQGDLPISTSWIKVEGLEVPLSWSNRFLLLAPDIRGSLQEVAAVTLKAWNQSIPLWRFLELTCWAPRTVYGYDELRKDAKGEPNPGPVNTGCYQPILASKEPGLRVRKAHKPRDLRGKIETRLWMESVRDWLRSGYVLAGSVKESGVTVLDRVVGLVNPQLPVMDVSSFGSVLSRNQLELPSVGPKTDKRVPVITNSYGYSAEYSSLQLLPVKGHGDLFNGAFEISRDIAEDLAVSNWDPNVVSVDQDSHRDRALAARVWSIRVLCPMGTFKGVAVVNDDLPAGTIRSHAENLKTDGIHTTDGKWIIAGEPKSSKEFSRLNIQYFLTHRWLFPLKEEIRQWIFTDAQDVYLAICEGKMDERLANVIAALSKYEREDQDGDSDEEESILKETQWAAFRWVRQGLTLRNSWGLTSFVFQGHTAFLRNWREGNLSPKVPCTLRLQIFSESFARLSGLYREEPIPHGTIRVVGKEGTRCAVVSDSQWLEMIPVHGTCDQDDDFDLFFRLIGGRLQVIVLRTPSGPGEYSVLEPDELGRDFAPRSTVYTLLSETTYSKREDYFPELEIGALPPRGVAGTGRLSKVADRQVTVWGVDFLMESLHRSVENPGVGGLSNLLMLWASAHNGEAPADLPAELSDMIDAVMQGGDQAQFEIITNWVNRKWLEFSHAVETGTVPVDAWLWNKRAPKGVPAGGKFHRLYRFSEEETQSSEFCSLLSYADSILKLFSGRNGKLQTWLQKNFEPHDCFAAMAEEVGAEKVKVEEDYLFALRAKMQAIEAKFAVKPADSSQTRVAKLAARKEEYRVSIDPELEAHLASGETLAAFAAAVYRHQGSTHKDGMLFSTATIRERFLDLVTAFVKLWKDQITKDAELQEELKSVALANRPW